MSLLLGVKVKLVMFHSQLVYVVGRVKSGCVAKADIEDSDGEATREKSVTSN